MDSRESETLPDIQAHTLYCGVTMTGKTTLARFHSRLLLEKKHRVIVYDPVGTITKGGDWGKDAVVITRPEMAERSFERESDAYVFVDEAADIFDHSNKNAHWLLRKGRHRNLYIRMVCHRPTMVHPNVRSNAAVAFCFRMSRTDATALSNDFGHSSEVADEICELDRGEFIVLQAGSRRIESFNVFTIVDSHRSHGQ